jgi:NMD protein affecting ribosome stability and mRNA decay
MQRDVRKFGISDKRGRRTSNTDPFLPHEGTREPSLCTTCHAAFHRNRWTRDSETYRELELSSKLNKVTCPACQKIDAGYPEGIVTLRGNYLWKHEDEIRNILKNEENKAYNKNPLERIIRVTRQEDELVIETTEEKLAEHLGRVLQRAHRGELKISWAGNPDLCRVSWERTS